MPNKFDGRICVQASEVGGTTNKKSNKKQTCAQKFHLVDVGEYLAWDSGHVTRGQMNIHVEYVSRAEILVSVSGSQFFFLPINRILIRIEHFFRIVPAEMRSVHSFQIKKIPR